MIKVEKCEDKSCNSCIDQSAYKIICKTNEHNGCEFYLCEDCMGRLLKQADCIKLGEVLKRSLNAILVEKNEIPTE